MNKKDDFETEESGHGESAEGHEEEKISIAQRENKYVCYLRTLLFLVLLIVTAGVCTAIFFYARRDEESDFDVQFHDHAIKLTSTFKSNAIRRLSAVESLAVSITTSAHEGNMVWPNVTIPDFERQVSFTLELAAVLNIIFFPIVTNVTRAGWEAYSVENQGWIQKSKAYQEARLPADFDEEVDNANIKYVEADMGALEDTIKPYLFRFSPEGPQQENGDGPFCPWWQMAPVLPVINLVNYNAFSHPTREKQLQAVIATQKPSVTGGVDFREVSGGKPFYIELVDALSGIGSVFCSSHECFVLVFPGRAAVVNMCLARRQGFMAEMEYEAGPVSDLYFPVFKENDNDVDLDKPREVAGVLTAYVYWQVYFANILPDTAHGVVAILENSCGEKFTYVIYGERVNYVGPGDLHDTSYDDMMVTTGWNAFLGGDSTTEDLLDGQCSYRVNVYPSQELEDSYLTSTPTIFTVVLVAVFLLTSIVFLLYDLYVEKRQKIVMKKAVQSTEVVQSLFPHTVRDRLFEEKEQGGAKTGAAGTEHLVDGFPGVEESVAIADLYQNCTVLFADLAGFTKWSDSREPKDVFALLEALYGAFDNIAKKRNVFKVETIGDCYVAITGLPRPQSQHAVIMAKFAAECMVEMNNIIHSRLVTTLGEETTALQMRVGLHSGAVTAGVLRGDRARFQLFGDTVNTASRMESNGTPGRIQASELTANLLVEAGKDAWVTERAGGVEAKGKGRMRTYWVQPILEATTTLSAATSLSRTDSNNVRNGNDTGSPPSGGGEDIEV